MTLTLFIFPNRYRAACMPWGKNLLRKNNRLFLRTQSPILFKILVTIIRFRAFNYVPIICYVSDPPFEFQNKNIRHLWWNDETELSRDAGNRDYFACRLKTPGFNWLFIKPDLSNLASTDIQRHNNKIVYFGEPGLDSTAALNSFEPNHKTPKIIDNFLASVQFESHGKEQDLHRFLGILLLYQNFTGVHVYGTGWLNYFQDAHHSNYSVSKRHSEYRNSICVDFGSKSGISCLYPRSIEILLEYGILFHKKQSDSYDIFGQDYCDYFSFNDLDDMVQKMYYIRNHDNIAELHYNLLMNSPLAKNNVKIGFDDKTVFEI